MSKKIVVTGATGLIGKKLAFALMQRGDEVIIFSRNMKKAKSIFPNAKECVEWNYKTPSLWENYLENCDAVIHLAGTNVFAKRWNDSFKKDILESREVSTQKLVEAIGNMQNKPLVFISASGVGYYGDGKDEILNEDSPSGNDFLAGVCKAWEKEAAKVETYSVRCIRIRTGLVLSPEEGALKQMLTPFKLFVGGPLGDGKQWASWLHIDDIVEIYLHAIDNPKVTGAINAASPNPVRMKKFAKTLGQVLNRPSLFPVPKFLLRIAVGEAAEVVIASQRINVKKLMSSGYNFKYTILDEAFKDLLKIN
jgi:uncharacterized protein